MFGVFESVVGSHLGTFQIYSMDNAQCQVSLRNRVSASGFSSPVSPAPSRCKRWFRSCGRRILYASPISLFFIISASQSGKSSIVGTFNPRLTLFNPCFSSPRFHPGLFRQERNNLKLLDAFLFTPTLLNAHIKVCYCKNEIFASGWADSVARVAPNFPPQSAKLLNQQY